MWIACNYCNKHLHRTFHLQSTLQTSTNKPPRSPVNSVLSLSLPDGETEVNVAGPWDQDTVWKRVSGSLSCSEFILTPWRISAWLKGSHLHDITTLSESSTLLFVPIHAASRLTIFYCKSFLWDLHRDHGNIPLTGEVVMLKLKIWVQNPEKRGEEAVCGCQFREALEAFCLQGAQHLLREITHWRGGCVLPWGCPAPDSGHGIALPLFPALTESSFPPNPGLASFHWHRHQKALRRQKHSSAYLQDTACCLGPFQVFAKTFEGIKAHNGLSFCPSHVLNKDAHELKGQLTKCQLRLCAAPQHTHSFFSKVLDEEHRDHRKVCFRVKMLISTPNRLCRSQILSLWKPTYDGNTNQTLAIQVKLCISNIYVLNLKKNAS